MMPLSDPAPGIPAPGAFTGPEWLVHGVWQLTLFIHVALVGLVLGGALLGAIAGFVPVAGSAQDRRTIARFFVRVNTWALPLGVTFAVAPLIFVQLALGHFFYTAAVLLAPFWIGLLGILALVYAAQITARRALAESPAPRVRAALLVQAVAAAAIAAIQVSMGLLHREPGLWAAAVDHRAALLTAPGWAPRLLHALFAAVAVAGAALAFASRRMTVEAGTRRSIARFGFAAVLAAIAAQLATGLWLLLALPRPSLVAVMRAGPAILVPLVFGLLLTFGALAIVAVALVAGPEARPRAARTTLEHVGATLALMVVLRHGMRLLLLRPFRDGEPGWEADGSALVFLLALASVAAGGILLVRRRADG